MNLVKKCDTLVDDVSDLLQLAKDEGVELTDEQLNAISGGGCESSNQPDEQSTGPTSSTSRAASISRS